MSFINKIKKKLKKENIGPVEQISEMSMSEREKQVYDQDKLSLQKMYEKWTCKEHWLLLDEGIPLLFGVDPKTKAQLDEELTREMTELWQHAQDCVEKKMLPVINEEHDKHQWQVIPTELYKWATISRIAMPDEFNTLMAFVVQTIKSTGSGRENVPVEGLADAMYQKHREIVLGAVASLLVNAPEQCKNRKGKISAHEIVRQIAENSEQWFGQTKPELSEAAMTDLINEYIKMGQPVMQEIET